MNRMKQYLLSKLLLITVLVSGLVLVGFGSSNLAAAATLSNCNSLEITGTYQCEVACVKRQEGSLKIFNGKEKNYITSFKIGDEDFYQVSIVSEDLDFTEREMGVVVGNILYTATERVSDDIFPVLEENILKVASCSVTDFTKVVRNPSKENFKTCKVECTKQTME